MKKKIIALLLALVCTLSLLMTCMAATYTQQEKTADALNELDLFRGKGAAGYDLDANLTRAEGATLLVRVLGKDKEASNWTAAIPFKDVPLWAMGYVGYAYQNGITNGTDLPNGLFSPNAELSDYMFLTLVLRALGYSDKGENAQFVWNDPYKLAAEVGLIDKAKADNDFTRGDAVEVLWNAMHCKLVGRNITLAEDLIAQGVFTKADFRNAQDIQKNGRKENAGTPVERPGTSGGSSGSGNGSNTGNGSTMVEEIVHPWETGGKQPSAYTWAEYNALDEKYQDGFYAWFEKNDMKFEDWQTQAQEEHDRFEAEELPWENGGKQPSEYTWAEYHALTKGQQIAFQQSFSSVNAFDAWMQQMQPDTSGMPWESGKRPDEYTIAEFEALSGAEQMAFQQWFGSNAAFERWMQNGQSEDSEGDPSWSGSKQPSEYTWAEFEALSGAQQMAFQQWFGSNAAFERWMQNAQSGSGSTGADMPWENGGKQPSAYTWAEFEALSGAEQMAFQQWFDDMDAFDAWMEDAQWEGSREEMPWENGGKQPSEYTWAEFERLTDAQQMAFQNWFDSVEDFEEWIDSVSGR